MIINNFYIRPFKFKDIFTNFFLKLIELILIYHNLKILIKIKKFLLTLKARVIFVIEEKNWAIEWDGRYITENLKKLNLIRAEITSPYLAKNKIVHYGTIFRLITKDGFAPIKNTNKYVSLWAHVAPGDFRIKYIPLLNKKLDFLHTPCNITKKKLIELGLNEDKIILIPIGVDLSIFKRFDKIKRIKVRKKYDLPTNKIVIGSFQKDGVGWGDGLEPKLIKGPDIFCEVIEKFHQNYDIHVFLTGPSRGYVKNRLEKKNIPYTHVFLNNYFDIVECYNALDLYIITSRAEGGPKALLEGMATGVPIISTKVGMAPDLITNGINGYIVDIDDVNKLYEYTSDLIENVKLREKIISNAYSTICKYSWENIAKKYYFKIYKKLL